MNMEKEKNMDTSDTDSMTTVNVNVKEYGNPMDYQEPPPAYRQSQNSTTVQVTRIIALAAVIIAAMLSISIVFSAWISAASCQQAQQQQASQTIPVLEALLQPEHLKSFLAIAPPTTGGSGDLDLAESKVDNINKGETNNNNLNKDVSSEEDNSSEGGDDGVTMIKLPLELNLQEHIFERNHRSSHMNCVIEKKKAEEIVDEQSKPLPALLGINMTTDPRYLHFTGEKMAISCDSGNDHRRMPQAPPPTQSHSNPQQQRLNIFAGSKQSSPLRDLLTSALAAAGSAPVHIIGPIPMGQEGPPSGEFQRQSHQSPLHFFNQMEQQGPPQHYQQQQHHQFFVQPPQDEQAQESSNNFGPLSSLGIPPHLIPVLVPHQGNNNNLEDSSNNNPSGPGPIFFHPQSSEFRERALPHPVPIMPRAHFQHGQFVIRPRRSIDNEDKPEEPQNQKSHKRVKRCACDCACKNHQD